MIRYLGARVVIRLWFLPVLLGVELFQGLLVDLVGVLVVLEDLLLFFGEGLLSDGGWYDMVGDLLDAFTKVQPRLISFGVLPDFRVR